MKGKHLLVLALITVLVLGLAVLDHYWSKRKEEREAEVKKILRIDWNAVRQVVLMQGENAQRVVLVREGKEDNSTWKLTAPVQDAVDKDAVDRLWNALKDLSYEQKYPAAGQDPGTFGLDRPRAEIVLKDAAGKELAHLQVGAKTPVGGNVYVALAGQPEVFVVAGYRESSLTPKLKDLRNRRLTDFEASQIAAITIEGPDLNPPRRVLERDHGIWVLKEPGRYLADSGKLYSLTSSLEFLEAQDFIAEQADDLGAYGLAEPRVRVRVQTEKGASLEIHIGQQRDDKEVYARIASRPRVVTVNKSFVDDVTRDWTEWRARNAIDLDYYNAQEAVIRSQDQTWHLVKESNSGETYEEHWYLETNGNRREIDRETVDEFLRNLDYVDADLASDEARREDLQNYGLDRPWLVVRIREKEKDWQEVHLGRKDSTLYEWNPHFPHVVYQLNDDDRKDLENAWKNLQPKLSPSAETKETKDTKKKAS